MRNFIEQVDLSTYEGRILQEHYSEEVKQRVVELIVSFSAFDRTGVPGIPYITAWKNDENIMWYEYAGHQFTQLFGCGTRELAPKFREAVVDHRLFHRTEVEAGIKETSHSQQELSGKRSGLREDVAQKGSVEADYKVSLAGAGSYIWLKDRATVETYPQDSISISFGFLTDVTNEMVHKDLLEQIGYIDQLTNLPNRAIMHRSLELKIAEYERNHINDFVFMMMDIDHFKDVNDSYGHRAGDYVLTTLGQVLTDVKRRSDDIGRYGGEEFYGIALGDIYEGKEFAERVRQRVEVTPFVFEEQIIPVTISIGLVAASEIKELSGEQLIDEADQRLYRAKQYGRNQVISENITF